MKWITKYSLLLAGAWVFLASCQRRPLEDGQIGKARIPIGAVWTVAGISPQNVTALFYNQQDGKLVVEHRFENNDNRIQTYADVPVGTYTVVLFNEIRGQIRGVGIRGYENLATLEAFALPNATPNATPSLKPGLQSRANDPGYVYEPDTGFSDGARFRSDLRNGLLYPVCSREGLESHNGIVPRRPCGVGP